jgi:hypothetical protein
MKRIPQRMRGLCAPSSLLLTLLARATDLRSNEANRIVAIGIYGKAMAAKLAELMAQQREAADAGTGELAAAGDEPAGGAEEVRAA